MKRSIKGFLNFLFPDKVEPNITRLIQLHTRRLFIVSLILMISFLAIIIALMRISIEKKSTVIIQTRGIPRADIIDRNGMILATTLQTVSLATNPNQVLHPYHLEKELHKIFPNLSMHTLKMIFQQKKNFVWIKRNLTPKQQLQVIDLGNPELFFLKSYPRIYPLGPLFSHIIGFTNIDGVGISGLEKSENSSLINNTHPLVVSLDARLQFILRRLLIEGVKKFHAKGAAGILLDIPTGQILALTSIPDFDPNHPDQAKKDQLFNRATLGVYELGSTFKIFTIAIGLDTKTITLKDQFDVSHPLKVGRFIIHDDIHKNNILSISDVFNYSSNIAAAKIALRFGGSTQKTYFKKFGLLNPTQLNIPEIGVPICPKQWTKASTVTISYGYGIAISPLQDLLAIASIVGPNTLIHPTLILDQKQTKYIATQPLLKNHNVVQNLRKLMYMNMIHGTGINANLPMYRIGGKTGTAELVKSTSRGYWTHHRRLTSFAALFPINCPQYALYVFLQEPQKTKNNPYSAESAFTAVPISKKIIIQLAPLLHLNPKKIENF